MKDKILEIMEDNTAPERVFGDMYNEWVLDRDKAADEICQMMADELARIYMAMELENNKTNISLKGRVRAHLEYKTFSPQQIDNALNKIK